MMTHEGIKPYVGVSGVVSPNMQEQLEAAAESAGLFDQGRVLALGVKATHKTQLMDVENKYGTDWYPVGEASFKGALRREDNGSHVIGVAQAYLETEMVFDADYRQMFMARLTKRGWPWMQAVQFDMLPWHRSTQLLDFLDETKEDLGISVFLQCHQDAMADLKPKGVAQRLGSYASVLDCVLFDASHGTGQRLEVDKLSFFLEAASEELDTDRIRLAVAGGLNAQNVQEDLPELLDEYPDLSWDAEGKLHPFNADGRRPLDLQVATDYLQASADIIRDRAATE